MEIKFDINEELNDIKIYVSAPSISQEVTNVLKSLEEYKKESIYAVKDNKVYEVKMEDVITFFTDDKNVYLKTTSGIFKTKYRLYEIEEKYPESFLRISNAVIVNTKQIKCFDISRVDNVIVKLNDGTSEYVSKRRIPFILKKLKQGGM